MREEEPAGQLLGEAAGSLMAAQDAAGVAATPDTTRPPGAPDAAATEGSTARIALSAAAVELLRLLREQHGPLMFHQSGGCCDGSAPMCYPAGEFRTGSSDVLLARLAVEGVPETVGFWMSGDQFARWRHTHLTVDVVPGRGSGFSLEAPEGVRFLIRSRLFTDEETERLDD